MGWTLAQAAELWTLQDLLHYNLWEGQEKSRYTTAHAAEAARQHTTASTTTHVPTTWSRAIRAGHRELGNPGLRPGGAAYRDRGALATVLRVCGWKSRGIGWG